MRKTALLNCATPLLSRPFSSLSCFTPNRSLYRYSAICYREDNFLPSFIFLLASCCSFVLDVARYAFELTTNHLLNNLMKSVQNLMTDLGLHTTKIRISAELLRFLLLQSLDIHSFFVALWNICNVGLRIYLLQSLIRPR